MGALLLQSFTAGLGRNTGKENTGGNAVDARCLGLRGLLHWEMSDPEMPGHAERWEIHCERGAAL